MEKNNIPYKLEINKTALLIIDMQNDFVREGAPMSLESCRKAIPNAKSILDKCREVNIPIIYLKFITGPEETLVWKWSPLEAPPVKCCWRNHKRKYDDTAKKLECSDIIDEIYPQPDDYIVEKYGYNGFFNTNLESILRANKKDTIIVFGALTPICIDDTVAGAFERQIKVFTVSDAIGYFTKDLHESSMRTIDMKYGRVLSTEKLLLELNNNL